ncbi:MULTISPECIES: glycosyltransferase [Bradyrhizobium]|uniref:glycosyltransferase n=1 Tax=Bradyrhizobium brasilense TaxID=1419277 RepID=UPI0014571E74|nr:glycosyltransferase [Bradyrhizobium brasilense]NLS67619.1 glycosyltransferase [Bradyrhizobium brasilense]
MRILILTGNLALGGAERQISVMARAMAALGHEVGIAVMYPGGELEAELAASDVKIFSLRKRGRWDLAGFFLALSSAVSAFRPDIFQTYLTTPNIAGALLQPRLGRVRLVWGIRSSDVDLSQYDMFSRHCARLEAFLSPRCDLAIANSHAGTRAHLGRGFRPRRFEVVGNGIDTERFKRRLEQRTRLRALWKVSELDKLCLSVGRIDPMKDRQTLLQSIRYWPTNALLAIVGSGSEQAKSKLRSDVRQLGLDHRVRLIEGMSDIENAYAAADMLILSSAFGEGFPNVVAEAMSSELPIVATDVGDVRDIVGSCGRIVPTKDPEAMGRAVADVLSMNGALSVDARLRITSNYSISAMVNRTLQLYRETTTIN